MPQSLEQQMRVIRGPHRYDREVQEYVPIGTTVIPAAPKSGLTAVLSGPHRYVPGEGGAPGTYIKIDAAPATVAPEPEPVETPSDLPPVIRRGPGRPRKIQQ